MKKLSSIIGIVTLLSVCVATAVTSVEGFQDNNIHAKPTLADDPGDPLGPPGGPCDFDLGDLNQDGAIDLLDLEPFYQLLLDNCAYQCEADIDQNGVVNLLDYCEFKQILAGGG